METPDPANMKEPICEGADPDPIETAYRALEANHASALDRQQEAERIGRQRIRIVRALRSAENFALHDASIADFARAWARPWRRAARIVKRYVGNDIVKDLRCPNEPEYQIARTLLQHAMDGMPVSVLGESLVDHIERLKKFDRARMALRCIFGDLLRAIELVWQEKDMPSDSLDTLQDKRDVAEVALAVTQPHIVEWEKVIEVRRLSSDAADLIRRVMRNLYACQNEWILRADLEGIGVPANSVDTYYDGSNRPAGMRAGGQGGQGRPRYKKTFVEQFVLHEWKPRLGRWRQQPKKAP